MTPWRGSRPSPGRTTPITSPATTGTTHSAAAPATIPWKGSAGRDWLDGGEGADTFVFGDGDRVADFQDGSDLISINAFGDINADNFETNVTIRQSGDDVAVEIGDAVLTLIGVSAADVTAEDFLLA